MARTNGRMDSSNHGNPLATPASSNAQRQYAVTATADESERTYVRNCGGYCDRTARLADPSALSSSAARLPATMKSEPKEATIRNQSDTSTPVAAAPATV